MCWSNGKWTDGTYKTDKPCTDKEVKNAMTALYTINQANQQKDKRDVNDIQSDIHDIWVKDVNIVRSEDGD